ncbi:uncharacterized protein LOC115363686 [Myripristis murdjan]|uniref:uncharacterized protein LOC115363686 n=1 Tax=Myripristis murdjan TaxID=586833 RepID=UPI001175F67E|nr:uncharacterized protein LOC115363686 [Myripristis murdjan]
MGRRVIFLVLLAVLLLDFTEGAEKQVYGADGGKLVLESPIPAEFKPLTSILWKHNRNMVVEWIEKLESMEYYGAFHGHTTLDRKTARLEIDNLTLVYSGVYSLELNGQLQSETYMVTVIKKVPKPTVTVEPLFCSSTSSLCKLSCKGGIPEAEPITYSWRPNTGNWTESSKLLNITNDDNRVESFFCQMKNPVSEEESEPWKNVFYPEKVPKPTVALEPLSCSPSSPPCALSCNGGIPEAEPITYSWRRDTGDWAESSKLLNITNDDDRVENFFCQMKNPVSEEETFISQRIFTLRGGFDNEIDELDLYFNVLAGVMAAFLPFFSLGFAVISGKIFSFLSRFDNEIGTLLISLGVLVGVMASIPLFILLVYYTLSFDVMTVVMAVVSLGCSVGSAVIAGKIFSLRGGFVSEMDELLLSFGVLVGVMAIVLPFILMISFFVGAHITEKDELLRSLGVMAVVLAVVFLGGSVGSAVIAVKVFSLRSRILRERVAVTPEEEEALEGSGAPTPAEKEALEGPGAPTPAEKEALDGPGAPTPAEKEALEGPGAPTPAEEALEGPGAPTPAEEALEGPGAPTPAEEAEEGPGALTPAEEEAAML